MTRANWIFVTVALALAACAKPKTSAQGNAGAAASSAPPAVGETTGGAPLDWSTLPAPAAAPTPCVLYPATGQYLVCLASDPFGCIHFGDVCTPPAK